MGWGDDKTVETQGYGVDWELDEAAGAMEGETSDAGAGERMAADRVWEQEVETDLTLGISKEGATLADVTAGLGVMVEESIGWGNTWNEDVVGRGT